MHCAEQSNHTACQQVTLYSQKYKFFYDEQKQLTTSFMTYLITYLLYAYLLIIPHAWINVKEFLQKRISYVQWKYMLFISFLTNIQASKNLQDVCPTKNLTVGGNKSGSSFRENTTWSIYCHWALHSNGNGSPKTT